MSEPDGGVLCGDPRCNFKAHHNGDHSGEAVKAVGMDQRAAFDDTVALAHDYNMDLVNVADPSLSWEHLHDMQVRIHEGDFSPSKLGRWLGWAQAAVVAAGVGLTLDDMKRINQARAQAR